MNKPDIASILSEGTQVPERRSLSEEAADALRELILLEKLAPGIPVPERDLAEGLGISRTPLKEALRILETEGLIEYGRTRRPRVADPSLDEITQNIAVLGALEALAGEQACAVALDSEIGAIVEMNRQMWQTPIDCPPLEFFHIDMEFHAAIVAAAGNAPLARTHGQYNARLWRARFLSSRQTDRRDNTLAEHDSIVNALSARDATGIATALRAHLQSTVTNLSRIRTKEERSA